jgi:hypothetical protein
VCEMEIHVHVFRCFGSAREGRIRSSLRGVCAWPLQDERFWYLGQQRQEARQRQRAGHNKALSKGKGEGEGCRQGRSTTGSDETLTLEAAAASCSRERLWRCG